MLEFNEIDQIFIKERWAGNRSKNDSSPGGHECLDRKLKRKILVSILRSYFLFNKEIVMFYTIIIIKRNIF